MRCSVNRFKAVRRRVVLLIGAEHRLPTDHPAVPAPAPSPRADAGSMHRRTVSPFNFSPAYSRRPRGPSIMRPFRLPRAYVPFTRAPLSLPKDDPVGCGAAGRARTGCLLFPGVWGEMFISTVASRVLDFSSSYLLLLYHSANYFSLAVFDLAIIGCNSGLGLKIWPSDCLLQWNILYCIDSS